MENPSFSKGATHTTQVQKMSASDQKVDEVKRILHGVRPDYTPYAQQLVENGFDSVVNLGMSKVEDLVACGVKRGHAREIVDSLAPKKQPVVKPVTSVVAPLGMSARTRCLWSAFSNF